MRTRLTIVGIVLAAAAAAAGVVVLLMALLGVPAGLAAGVVGAAAVLGAYRRWVQPWQHRWGATDEEVAAALPGDGIIPDPAGSTTRAITITAAPGDVWPWLVQLGYGRAGWYSYDWIDNDGRPSADRVVPELQDLAVGDQILMGPGMGPGGRELVPGPAARRRRDPAGQPLAGPLAADPGHGVLGPAQRPRGVSHGAPHAQGHQGAGGADRRQRGRLSRERKRPRPCRIGGVSRRGRDLRRSSPGPPLAAGAAGGPLGPGRLGLGEQLGLARTRDLVGHGDHAEASFGQP